VIAWLLIQAGSILFPTFEATGWVMKVFVTVIAAGFVLALFIAWAFEMTPQGMKRTADVSPDEFIPPRSKRKFATLIVGRSCNCWRLAHFPTLAHFEVVNGGKPPGKIDWGFAVC